MSWFDVLGLVGVAAILVAYALLQTGRLRAEAVAYSALNAVGAALVLVSLRYAFNLAAAVVEGAWLLISLYGLLRAWRASVPR
jgi:hypothetical protein